MLHIASRERKDSPPPPRFHEDEPTEKTSKLSMDLLYKHGYLSLALALVLEVFDLKYEILNKLVGIIFYSDEKFLAFLGSPILRTKMG